MPLHLRHATLADVSSIVARVESAYRGASGARGWTTESQLIDGQRTDDADIATTLQAPGTTMLLLEDDDAHLVACCLVEARGTDAYFGLFAVDPDWQAGGVGKTLLAHAESFARDTLLADAMVLSVIEQRHELIAWYVRRGYTRTGETLPFPYGNVRAGIPKRDDLRFMVMRKALRVPPPA